MPISDVDVVIFDYPYGAIPELGIGAETPSQYLIEIYIDPEFPGLVNSFPKEFKSTIAHELHHAVRFKNPGYGTKLLEALISEGLADHFDTEVNNTPLQLWNRALNEEELEKFNNLAKKEYFSENYNHAEWFFGSSKDIPRWTGYNLGFYLVEKYLKVHPDKKASTLYNAKAEEFLK
jgi:uncharacterized protein YjaZ